MSELFGRRCHVAEMHLRVCFQISCDVFFITGLKFNLCLNRKISCSHAPIRGNAEVEAPVKERTKRRKQNPEESKDEETLESGMIVLYTAMIIIKLLLTTPISNSKICALR